MSSSKVAFGFGVVFLLIGILGFVPGITVDGHLMGIFEVDAVHNIIHILSGILGLVLAKKAPKMFLKVFGVAYLGVTLIGFVQHDTVLGLFTINAADNILHLVVSAVALYFGFKRD